MYVYITHASWGEYSDSNRAILGVYSSLKKAKTKTIELLKTNKGWPINNLFVRGYSFDEERCAWSPDYEMIHPFNNCGRIHIQKVKVQ